LRLRHIALFGKDKPDLGSAKLEFLLFGFQLHY